MAATAPGAPFITSIAIRGLPPPPEDDEADPLAYVREIPAVRHLLESPLALDPHVTFLVGDNGSGKSTLIEALALALNLNAEGGGAVPGASTRFETRNSHSSLNRYLDVERGAARPMTSFFLRAESFFNLATDLERGGARTRMEAEVFDTPLHEQSHGESFLSLVLNRFGPRGLYILDEPEAALSVRGQLALMHRMRDLVERRSQFVIATHSPLLTGFPDAAIYELGDAGIRRIEWEETDQVSLTRSFLEDRERFLHYLFADD